jgi:hypothetical protein
MVKKAISIFLVAQGAVFVTLLVSKGAFASAEVAFLSAFLVIVGSSYAYKNMVNTQVKKGEYEEKRDLLDEIEDPHELYDDTPINDAPVEELDLKAIVKEEKGKIKTFNLKSMKHGAKGSVSAFRLVPYLFLILGFIALKNNNLLELRWYLPALAFGIVVASLITQGVTKR